MLLSQEKIKRNNIGTLNDKVIATTPNIQSVVTETISQYIAEEYWSQKAATFATPGILVANIR